MKALDYASVFTLEDFPQTRRMTPRKMYPQEVLKASNLFINLGDSHSLWVRDIIHQWMSVCLLNRHHTPTGVELLLSKENYAEQERLFFKNNLSRIKEIIKEQPDLLKRLEELQLNLEK